MLNLLLRNGANVSCEIEGGLTLLHMAIYEGKSMNFRIILYFIINSKFMITHKIDKEQMVQMLIEFGADVNQIAENGLTALHLAAKKGIVMYFTVR